MKKVNYFLLIVTLFIPFVINASSYTYEEGKFIANNYFSEENFYDDCIIDGSQISLPFEFNGKNIVNENFEKGGLLNKKEYSIIGGKDSYLFDGLAYFTMTEENDKIHIVNMNDNELVDKNSNSNVRITGFTKPDVKVKGEGSYDKPWEFVIIFNYSKTIEYKEEEQIIEIPKDGTYLITLYGAQGAGPEPNGGGKGGMLEMRLSLNDGDKLVITTGGQNGYNGGGSGGAYNGGGATTVEIQSSTQTTTYIAAGGGGGGNQGWPGIAGGPNGSPYDGDGGSAEYNATIEGSGGGSTVMDDDGNYSSGYGGQNRICSVDFCAYKHGVAGINEGNGYAKIKYISNN